MPKKTTPPIRVGTKKCTYVTAGDRPDHVFRCELTALRVNGELVEEVNGDRPPRDVRGDLRAPDGTEYLDVPLGMRHAPDAYWCRPFITSMRVR